MRPSLSLRKKKAANFQNDIGINNRHSFLFTEAYKSLRTNVLFSLQKDGCRKLMVTSSLAGEGKSTVATQLAVSFAQMGASVLMADCDLRRGKVHRLFDAKRSPGLANVLAGFSDINTAVQKTRIDNLYLLPAGVVPPNPAELLASGRMDVLMEELSKSFDYIIMDTSPINVISDALPLAGRVDGVIVVARQNYTDRDSLAKCIKNLEFASAKVLGVVFNDVSAKDSAKGRRYGYYKGDYYSSHSSAEPLDSKIIE